MLSRSNVFAHHILSQLTMTLRLIILHFFKLSYSHDKTKVHSQVLHIWKNLKKKYFSPYQVLK